MATVARENAALEPKELHGLLLEEVARFAAGMPPHNDTTLIVVKAV